MEHQEIINFFSVSIDYNKDLIRVFYAGLQSREIYSFQDGQRLIPCHARHMKGSVWYLCSLLAYYFFLSCLSSWFWFEELPELMSKILKARWLRGYRVNGLFEENSSYSSLDYNSCVASKERRPFSTWPS